MLLNTFQLSDLFHVLNTNCQMEGGKKKKAAFLQKTFYDKLFYYLWLSAFNITTKRKFNGKQTGI